MLSASRRCAFCSEVKPAEAFTRNRRRADGLEPYCRPCLRDRRARARAADPEHARQASNARAARFRARHDRRALEDPAARRAYNLVHKAVARGELERPDTCSTCATPGPVEGHHHLGYAHPLEVLWLCRPCHEEAHHALA